MFANVTAESTGRLLAVRLFNAAHDEGMHDMLSFLIARDTMHQQQWLAVIEELGGSAALPIPNSFDQSQEKQDYSYVFLATNRDAIPPAVGRWSEGPSLGGRGKFSVRQNEPLGDEPVLGPARPDGGAQREQIGPV
jgi:Mn-containing catalase